MTNQDIYSSALRLSSEVERTGENQDYLERAGYLIPVFCFRFARLDQAYRNANGLPAQNLPDKVKYTMTETFPLSPAFAAAAAASLASMLVVEEAPELSDRLSAICTDAITQIRESIPPTPFQSEAIVDRYGF